MNIEIQTAPSQTQEIPVRLTRRGTLAKKAAEITLGVGLAAGVAVGAVEANDADFHGEQTVQIDEQTITGIAENHVQGAENHASATIDRIAKMNPEVFQDGTAHIESEDVGAEITIPESVD